MTAIPLKRVVQLPAFCGPATVCMLLSQHGVDVSQEEIAQKGNALDRVLIHGMRLDELALAVRSVAPELRLWAKRNATLQEMEHLIETYKLPVGVEWHDDLTEDDEILTEDEDPGHYSVILSVDPEKKELLMRDPSSLWKDNDRLLTFEEFEKRWFDTNDVVADAPEEAKAWMDDYHVMYVIAPRTMQFPPDIGLKKVRVPAYLLPTTQQPKPDPIQENASIEQKMPDLVPLFVKNSLA